MTSVFHFSFLIVMIGQQVTINIRLGKRTIYILVSKSCSWHWPMLFQCYSNDRESICMSTKVPEILQGM